MVGFDYDPMMVRIQELLTRPLDMKTGRYLDLICAVVCMLLSILGS